MSKMIQKLDEKIDKEIFVRKLQALGDVNRASADQHSKALMPAWWIQRKIMKLRLCKGWIFSSSGFRVLHHHDCP